MLNSLTLGKQCVSTSCIFIHVILTTALRDSYCHYHIFVGEKREPQMGWRTCPPEVKELVSGVAGIRTQADNITPTLQSNGILPYQDRVM